MVSSAANYSATAVLTGTRFRPRAEGSLRRETRASFCGAPVVTEATGGRESVQLCRAGHRRKDNTIAIFLLRHVDAAGTFSDVFLTRPPGLLLIARLRVAVVPQQP